MVIRHVVAVFGLALVAIALTGCGGDESDGGQTSEPTAAESPAAEPVLADVPARAIEARPAQITVDGDASDWEGIAGLSILLEPIGGSDAELKDASIRVAYDDEFAYALFRVIDDYN